MAEKKAKGIIAEEDKTPRMKHLDKISDRITGPKSRYGWYYCDIDPDHWDNIFKKVDEGSEAEA